MGCTPISVQFELLSPDQLRKITLGLARSCMPDGTAVWQVHFKLGTRFDSTAEFFPPEEVSVPVPEEDHAAAEEMAKGSVCPEQEAAAWFAADALKQHSEMGNPDDPEVHDAVLHILQAGT